MRTVLSIVWIVGLLVLVGCGRGEEKEPPVAEEGVATRPPATAAVDETLFPAAPAAPAVAPETEALDRIETPNAVPLITPAIHGHFVRGISLAEAKSLLAINPEAVGGEGSDTSTYRWEDTEGTYFTARFDEGALVVRSALRQREAPAAAAEPVPVPANSAEMDGMPVAEVAPGVYVPLERAITSSVEQPRGVTAPPRPVSHSDEPPMETKAPEASGPTVVIAGANRRRQQAVETRSYQPRAKLPDFYHGFSEGRLIIHCRSRRDGGSTSRVASTRPEAGKLRVPTFLAGRDASAPLSNYFSNRKSLFQGTTRVHAPPEKGSPG